MPPTSSTTGLRARTARRNSSASWWPAASRSSSSPTGATASIAAACRAGLIGEGSKSQSPNPKPPKNSEALFGIFEPSESLVEIGDRLLQHRAMRGCACGLKIRERSGSRERERCTFRAPGAFLRRDLRRLRYSVSSSILLRFDGLAFPPASHLVTVHQKRLFQARGCPRSRSLGHAIASHISRRTRKGRGGAPQVCRLLLTGQRCST